jgi:hypothetical protein
VRSPSCCIRGRVTGSTAAPEELLPEELTDGFRGIPRRVNGVLQLAM